METFQENVIKFQFSIENFNKYFMQEHREVCSKSIFNYDSYGNKSEWHLVVYPDGRDFTDEGYFSIFLELLESKQKILNIKYKLYLIDCFGTEVNARTSVTQYDDNVGWGWGQFIKQEDLFKNGLMLFPDGVLTFGCEFTILGDDIISHGMNTAFIKNPEKKSNFEDSMTETDKNFSLIEKFKIFKTKKLGLGVVIAGLMIGGFKKLKSK